MRKRKSAGFSLIELIIAISLASIVLVAVCGLAAQAVRYQMSSIRRGGVSGWAVVSFSKMTKELEDANVLVWPSPGTPATDGLIACQNWSRKNEPTCGAGDLRYDCTKPLVVIYYCYQAAVVGPPAIPPRMWRYESQGGVCPASSAANLPSPCDGSQGGYTSVSPVVWNVEKLGGANFFNRDDNIGGVRLQYVVGAQTADNKYKVPITQSFDMKVVMQKQYTDTQD